MKKNFKTISLFLALSVSISAVNAQSKQNSTHPDNIPEYLEINDDEILFTVEANAESNDLPISGATLAWRDIRPETDPNVVPSRSVTIGLGQYLEVEYPGNEWIYLGEAEETNHLRYYGRSLGRENTVFTLHSKDVGNVLLHFYCIDPLDGTSISDYLEVIIEDRTTGISKKAVAPSYAKAVPANQHSNEFDYVTPTVKEVHKEPESPYTLEKPNPPKENTVAVPKTSTTKPASSSTSSAKTATSTGTSSSKTTSNATSTTKEASTGSSKASGSSGSSTSSQAAASSSSTKATASAGTSSSKTASSGTSSTKTPSSNTTRTTSSTPSTSASTSSSTTSSSITKEPSSSITKESSSSTTKTPSSSSTRSASSTPSTTTTSTNSPASASIATGNPTTRSISRSASSPVEDITDDNDYVEYTPSESSDGYDSFPTFPSSSSSSAIAATGSDASPDYSGLSAKELLEKAHSAYDKAQYGECLSYLEEYLNTSAADNDEALFLQGQAYEAPGSSRNIKAALNCYETLVNHYPYSKYWERANERVIYIKRFYINIR
ncbi:MAG: hypothetical protein J6S91_11540 [Treponema sp.]|nr:hypothetical protein [Treponema sp.]